MNRLKELRAEHHKTQQEIGDYLNLTQRAVSLYELGQRDIPNSVLQKLADYYCVSTDEILGRKPLNRELRGDLDKAEEVAKLVDGLPIETAEFILGLAGQICKENAKVNLKQQKKQKDEAPYVTEIGDKWIADLQERVSRIEQLLKQMK